MVDVNGCLYEEDVCLGHGIMIKTIEFIFGPQRQAVLQRSEMKMAIQATRLKAAKCRSRSNSVVIEWRSVSSC